MLLFYHVIERYRTNQKLGNVDDFLINLIKYCGQNNLKKLEFLLSLLTISIMSSLVSSYLIMCFMNQKLLFIKHLFVYIHISNSHFI